MTEQFEKLDMVQSEDEESMDDVKLLIDERLFQTKGFLFKYDAIKDKNLLVAQNSFLCIDRMVGEKRHHYMFHITDQAQKVSYTRVEVEFPDLNYSFSEVEKVLMWIGKPKEGSTEIPAWSFMIEE